MADSSLANFIDTVCGESHLRVEADLGDGFVRLRSSEAERRQAAQDIRSSEDILIELLRNARDAGARHIFVATQKTEGRRFITIVDDGAGIPALQQERIFEPRVTSKLDTAHMDKWGMHGRGMALYSIAVNAETARVASSARGLGASIAVETDTERLGEKTDQSTFPRFEREASGSFAMRGPKNLLRTAAEFALEHRDQCSVFFGTPVEVAAALYAFAIATTSPAARAFPADRATVPLVKRLALTATPDALADECAEMALPFSSRSARRIMDGTIEPPAPLIDRLRDESFPSATPARPHTRRKGGDSRGLRLAEADVEALRESAARSVEALADRYFLEAVGRPEVSVGADAIRITVPIRKMS